MAKEAARGIVEKRCEAPLILLDHHSGLVNRQEKQVEACEGAVRKTLAARENA